MMWRLLTWGIIAATLLFPVASGFGAERVVTRRDNFGEDLRFVDQYLGLTWPEYYRTQAPVEVGFEFSLDDVYVGRYDVNGDGQAELFVHVQYVGLCGSGGCPTYVFERKNGEWANVSRIVGDAYMDVWVDPDTGYKTVFSYYSGLRWTGERYQFIGDAQVVEVSAQMPPDFEGEGGCVEPRQDGVEYLMAYVATKKPMCLIYDPTHAVRFQRQLGLSRYETAFQILHKLRSGMVRPGTEDMIGGQPARTLFAQLMDFLPWTTFTRANAGAATGFTDKLSSRRAIRCVIGRPSSTTGKAGRLSRLPLGSHVETLSIAPSRSVGVRRAPSRRSHR